MTTSLPCSAASSCRRGCRASRPSRPRAGTRCWSRMPSAVRADVAASSVAGIRSRQWHARDQLRPDERRRGSRSPRPRRSATRPLRSEARVTRPARRAARASATTAVIDQRATSRATSRTALPVPVASLTTPKALTRLDASSVRLNARSTVASKPRSSAASTVAATTTRRRRRPRRPRSHRVGSARSSTTTAIDSTGRPAAPPACPRRAPREGAARPGAPRTRRSSRADARAARGHRRSTSRRFPRTSAAHGAARDPAAPESDPAGSDRPSNRSESAYRSSTTSAIARVSASRARRDAVHGNRPASTKRGARGLPDEERGDHELQLVGELVDDELRVQVPAALDHEPAARPDRRGRAPPRHRHLRADPDDGGRAAQLAPRCGERSPAGSTRASRHPRPRRRRPAARGRRSPSP